MYILQGKLSRASASPVRQDDNTVQELLPDGAVEVDFTNRSVENWTKTYALMVGSCEIGDVENAGEGGFIVTVAESLEMYVARYEIDTGGANRGLDPSSQGEKTII